MNQIKNLRKLAIFVLLIAGLLTLAACGSKESTPYGSISDDVYMSIGDVEVTELELYDQLRLQGASILATMIDEKVFADQLASVEQLLSSGDEDLNTYLDDTVNQAIHGGSDQDSLEDLYTKYSERWSRNIEQFADSLYLLDNSIVIDDVIVAIEGLSATQENAYSGYSSIPLVVERYGLRVAQRYYAQQLLEEEIKDEEDTNYISDENVLSYYQNTMRDRYDVDALVIRFINLNEANAALYMMSIKSDAKGLWYKVPDIRISDVNDPEFVDLTDETPQTGALHVKNILDDLGLLGKLGVDYLDRDQISVKDYEDYYKKYIISTSRSDGFADEALTTDAVKDYFISIYNILNPAAQVEKAVDGSIVGAAGSEFESTYTYDDLTALNTSLRSHLYTTLTAEASMEDPDDTTEGKPYSSRVQTFGTSRYLVFKLSDDSALEDDIYNEESEAFIDTPEAEAKKLEVYELIKEGKLSSSYISTKVNELYEDRDLNIYDFVIRAFYEQSYGYEGTTNDKSGDILADLGDVEITVDEFYERLERSYGINLALDIASNKYLVDQGTYVVSEEDMKDYQTQFEDIISQFSADNFASSGYPASMGRQNFLLLAFGATTNAESINQLFVYPELRQQYLDDIEAHYGSGLDSIYVKLAELAELQYNNFKSISVSHLLIYFDEDGDGSPDDPQEYLDSLGDAGKTQVLQGLTDLVELLYVKVGDYTGIPAGLSGLATEFNESGRINRGSVIPPYDYQIELIWSQYRQLGFYLKFENISTPITNTSNFITGQSVLDKVFYDRAMELHATLAEIEEDDSKFPYLDLYDQLITEDALDEVKSSFGWHLILTTAVKEPASAIYDSSEDEDGKYITEDGLLSAYNRNSDPLTSVQIEYYLTEQKTEEGVVLPTEVQTAISSYLTPVLTRYQNTYMQRELVFKLMEDAVFANAANTLRFNTIREINRRQLDEYLLSPTGFHDQNYDNLYGTWFNVLEN